MNNQVVQRFSALVARHQHRCQHCHLELDCLLEANRLLIPMDVQQF